MIRLRSPVGRATADEGEKRKAKSEKRKAKFPIHYNKTAHPKYFFGDKLRLSF
jgi:hypothetical protein